MSENEYKSDTEHVNSLKKAIKDSTGFDSVTFMDEDGSNKVTYDLNTPEEQEAVDKGVQDALPQDARWHRREARRLLVGKKGMTDEQKIARVIRAQNHLAIALDMMEGKG